MEIGTNRSLITKDKLHELTLNLVNFVFLIFQMEETHIPLDNVKDTISLSLLTIL